ncbi:MAG TPA: hypothetical protein VH331_13490 [Allosphingosinicella sp.]|nr:hypothetical protein [Allosphingosinicella sp.]
MVAAALILGACSTKDPVAGEIACQRRMVEIPAAPDVSPQAHPGPGLPAAFETMSRRYAAIDLDGCTEDQRTRIPDMARLTHEIARLAGRLPRPGAADQTVPVSPISVQFVAALKEFEKRRQTMQRDLDQMEAVRLR